MLYMKSQAQTQTFNIEKTSWFMLAGDWHDWLSAGWCDLQRDRSGPSALHPRSECTECTRVLCLPLSAAPCLTVWTSRADWCDLSWWAGMGRFLCFRRLVMAFTYAQITSRRTWGTENVLIVVGFGLVGKGRWDSHFSHGRAVHIHYKA